MSAAINYVLGRLLGRGTIDIPKRIFEVVLRDTWLEQHAPVTLESKILNNIIKPRVIVDMDITGGEEVLVDLSNVTPWVNEEFAKIYNIPPELVNFREIMAVMSVSYVPFGRVFGQKGNHALSSVPIYNNELMVAGQQVLNSVSAIPNVSTSRAELVGFNMVRVSDRQRMHSGYVLRCYVTNDTALQNMDPRAYMKFYKLCLWATKAWLYNHIVLEMGDHYLQRGQELSVFKTIIEKWEDAAEQYEIYKAEEWDVVPVFGDEDFSMRMLQAQIPIGL